MMFRTSILAFMASASTVMADCATPNDTFLTCTFGGGRQYVDVCVEGADVTYTFGFTNAPPDLQMSVPVVDARFEPWPGIGSSLYEIMTFTNGDTSYAVLGGATRGVGVREGEKEPADVQEEAWGEIEVIAHLGHETKQRSLAILLCDAGTSSYVYGGSIFDAKTAAGQCWGYEGRHWEICK